MTYYIGIDNSSLDHKVHILKSNGDLYSKFIIENNLNGFNILHECIKTFDETMIGFELPHGPLTDYLREKNYTAYSLNPLKVKRFKETIIVSGNKNDNIDAEAINVYRALAGGVDRRGSATVAGPGGREARTGAASVVRNRDAPDGVSALAGQGCGLR